MLHKHNHPICEHDTARTAMLEPKPQEVAFPAKAVCAFMHNTVQRYAEAQACTILTNFSSEITADVPVYQALHQGQSLALCALPIGAPAAAMVLEQLLAQGCTQVVALGCCGSLADIAENTFLVPTQALRDEGTSYHYLPPSRWIDIDAAAVQAIASTLAHKKQHHKKIKVWSTDGLYRETPAMVEHRRSEGCAAVDMECAALAAVAEFRGVQFGQLLFTADSLAQVGHDERGFGKASFCQATLELAMDAVLAF